MSAKKKVDVITMGCSKNLCDSERLLSQLSRSGYDVEHNPRNVNGDIVVINTCGFIGDAKEESIEMIFDVLSLKKKKKVQKVFVMGCLSQRYLNDLKEEIPEVDGWFGKFDWDGITKTLNADIPEIICHPYERILTGPSHYAYLKISEGCNRKCAFCAIPLITGPHQSRRKEDLLDEVKGLVDKGVKEFNVIAQDLSSYGLDLYRHQALPELIDSMSQIAGVEWIRLHYAYPAQFPEELLDVMASRDNVCKYLDIALQHVSDKVLSNMRRHITGNETVELIEKIRKKVPDIHLRTTLMVGFPGEGEKEFDELLDFVGKTKFERMGAFAYCEEEDTFAAHNFQDCISEEVKQERLERLLDLQEGISLEVHKSKIGKSFNTIIDREEDDFYVGRTQWDSPEVDPEVLIKKDRALKTGDFYNVTVTSVQPFELYGVVND